MDEITTIDFNGQPSLRLATRDGASAVVTLLGAQVVSWKTADGREQLFLSERSVFDGSRAIRGGIPVCWPQFAEQGKLPRHGLVRTRRWDVATRRAEKGYALATLAIADDDQSRAVWPYAFELELTVLLEASRLSIELEVGNTGFGAFVFTGALHSYLRVAEVEEARLEGLARTAYRDKTRAGAKAVDTGDHLSIEAETDRIYMDVGNALLLRDAQRSLAIHAEGFPDVVVWNPWQAQSSSLPDMADADFRRMLCVEAAVAARPVELAAGERWVGRQTLLALG